MLNYAELLEEIDERWPPQESFDFQKPQTDCLPMKIPWDPSTDLLGFERIHVVHRITVTQVKDVKDMTETPQTLRWWHGSIGVPEQQQRPGKAESNSHP